VRVLQNPFSGDTACVPTISAVPSMKNTARAFFNMVTGTTGTGAVVIAPFSCCFNDTISATPTSPTVAAIATTAAYSGSTIPNYTSSGVAIGSTNSMFATTQSESAVEVRLVACGLRVRNVTPLLNRGGSIIGVETPAHDDITNQTFGQVNAYDQSGLGDASGNWNAVTWHPIRQSEYDFFNGAFIGSNNTEVATNRHCLAFVATAPPSTPQTYEVEIYVVFETVGDACHGLTPSESDPVGMASVQNHFSSVQARKPAVLKNTYETVGTMASVLGGVGALGGLASWARTRYIDNHQL